MIQEKTGVLLVNTGSPAAPTPQAVGAYLSEFLMDGAVRPLPALPWWLILHACILPCRKKTSAAKYREVWLEKGSPLVVYARLLGIPRERWSLSYQSPFEDNRTWLGPFTTSRLGELAREARQDGGDVYCICPGFAFDCLETLYDVPHELAPAFLAGLSDADRADAEPAQLFEVRALLPRLVYVPCLNDSHAHARVVHGLACQALLAG